MTDRSPAAGHRIRKAGVVALATASAAALVFGGLGQPVLWASVPAAAAFLVSVVQRSAELPAPAAVPLAEPNRTPDVAASLQAEIIEDFALPLLITEGNEIVTASSVTARQMFPGLGAGRPISLAIRDPDFLDALVACGRDGQPRIITMTESAPVSRAVMAHIRKIRSADARLLPAKPGIICVFEDLTEQRATERMRVDFIANASHELRTPLASLLGFIETLQGPAREDTKARERFLPIMRDQAARMARLIDDLLSLSRAELRAHQQPTTLVDLRSTVSEIIDSLSLSAKERGVKVDAALPAVPAMIRGDRDDLLRLVENLVENGIRYGRDGKLVKIELSTADTGEIVLSVADFGPGIPAEHIPRLTERFYRADVSHSREIGGTGLGLAIVKHLVARHRARLEIESQLGQGATFKVLFPAADADRG